MFLRFTFQYRVVRDREIELKAAGVASIKVRSDNKLVAAGCWDGRYTDASSFYQALHLAISLPAHLSIYPSPDLL